jgi:transposase
VVAVEQWAELRRLHFVAGVSIRELQRRTGLGRNTIRRALRSEAPPAYVRRPGSSKLDGFRQEIQRLLGEDPRLPGSRIFELIAELGFDGGKTLVYDYVAELRPLYAPPPRTFQRTAYRRGEILQFDLWQPARDIPVGYGQTRRGWVLVAALGYSRAGAGTLIFSKQADDILAGLWRCMTRLGGLPKTVVIDREGALHAGGGHPTDAFAAFCGQLPVSWHFCDPGDPQAKGLVERLQGYMATSFEPGRSFINQHDFQDQLDDWFDTRANRRLHRTLRRRPLELLTDELEVMRPLPAKAPSTERRWVLRVPPDPHLRFDTNDYSLHPLLVGRRVEVAVDAQHLTAVALDTGELACRHQRCFARHRTITALEHARALKTARPGPDPIADVEIRPLARYDAPIPA